MRIGTAPVSFGVYGSSEEAFNLAPEQLVEAMAASGYQGAELPPAGYAGPPGAATTIFQRQGLTPVGIYIPIHFADPRLQAADEARMEDALRELEAANAGPRLAILADEGSETLLHHPGRRNDPTHALGTEDFRHLTDSVNRIAGLIRRRGLTASFHPHVSTYVESPTEIERLLAATDIDLAFDTGHIALGGGDVLACWVQWRDRINHVHLKDVRPQVMKRAKAEGRGDFDVWWADVSVPLGEGDLGLEKFLALLHADRYLGWVVVEQDRAPPSSQADMEAAIATQTANLQWIHQIGVGLGLDIT